MVFVANPNDFVPQSKAPAQLDLGYAPFFSGIYSIFGFIGAHWQSDLWYSKVIIIY